MGETCQCPAVRCPARVPPGFRIRVLVFRPRQGDMEYIEVIEFFHGRFRTQFCTSSFEWPFSGYVSVRNGGCRSRIEAVSESRHCHLTDQSTITRMLCRRRLFLDAFRTSSRVTRRLSSTVSTDAKPYYVTTPIFYPNASASPLPSFLSSRTQNQRMCSTTHWPPLYPRDCGHLCAV